MGKPRNAENNSPLLVRKIAHQGSRSQEESTIPAGRQNKRPSRKVALNSRGQKWGIEKK